MSLSSQILVGLISGLIVGLFFGAWVEPLGVLGDAFVLLLQMTVLPYLAVSLMVGLGALRPEGAARLAWRAGGALLILFWHSYCDLSQNINANIDPVMG